MSETGMSRSKNQDFRPQRYGLILSPTQTRTTPWTMSTPVRCRSRTLCPETPHCRSRVLYTAELPCSNRVPQPLRSSREHSQCRQRHRCDLSCPVCQTIPIQHSCSTTCMERRTHCPPPCLRSNEPCDPNRLASIQGPDSHRRPSKQCCHQQTCDDRLGMLPQWMSTPARHRSHSLCLLPRLQSAPPLCTVESPGQHRRPQHDASSSW